MDHDARLLLTPSQAVSRATPSKLQPKQDGEQQVSATTRRSRRRKRTLGNKKKHRAYPVRSIRSASSGGETNKKNTAGRATTALPRDPSTFPRAGNAPDIFWRSIPIDHLRLHPQFKALPDPNDITSLDHLEDVRLFRQDSWQWDALHVGRCTTSQAIAALGLLEPNAAQVLSVPVWWQKRSAYSRLRQTPLRTLEDMNRVLCSQQDTTSHPMQDVSLENEVLLEKRQKTTVGRSNITSESLWVHPASEDSNFTMDYTYELTEEEREIRRSEAILFSKDLDRGKYLSRWWGDIHEATAALIAINYFGKRDSGFVLEETGMCGASHMFNHTTSGGILIGATPDGIIRHSDGRVEALEVKNHCPFIAPYANKQRITKKSRKALNKLYAAASRNFDVSKGLVFPCYVPQLQLEMFCIGEECRSAVMIRLTARSGAMIVRMHRDDEWIEEMLYWLNRFQTDFVDQDAPPDNNFFWNNPSDRSRYQAFVQSTKAKSLRDVELVDRIPFEAVQRMGIDCPLFLD